MKARTLIESASYGPDEVKIMCQAFDEAWDSIAGNYGNPLALESARQSLANAILTAAKSNVRELDALKREALQLMASADRGAHSS